MKYWVLLDFETASATNLKKAGPWRYSECPTTEILCAAVQRQAWKPWVWHPVDGRSASLLNWASDPDCVFMAFNAAFEKAIWRNIMVPTFGFPDIPNERWHDVQAVAAMKVVGQDVKNVAARLGLKEQKQDFDIKKMSRASKAKKTLGEYDRSIDTLAQVDKYCLQDVATEVEMHKRLGWLPPGERVVWLLNQKVNERGIRIDIPYVRQAKRIVADASAVLLAEFRSITGITPTQGARFKNWLLDHGVLVGSLDKEHLADILGAVAVGDEDDRVSFGPNAGRDLPGDVRRALSIRQLIGSSSIAKLDRMEMCVCSDGRVRGTLQYHGTGPGRSAGRLLQPHNFPKPTLKEDDEIIPVEKIVAAIMSGDNRLVEETIGPAIETVVGGLRHALVPEKENTFISGDYSGIQARLVLAAAGQHDKAALMASGVDVYCDMAEQIFKRPIDKKKDPWERGIGKNSVLGLGFQMGGPTFQFKYAQDQTAAFCANVVQIYRKEWAPKVPFFWYGLQDAARKAVWDGRPQEAFGVIYALEGGWLSARLPSGRKMWYRNPQKVMRPMPWDADDIRPAWTYQASKNGVWRTIDAFGGQEAENVIMGMERDIMTHAQLLCEKEGLPVVLEVHDEILVEPRAGQADEKMLKQIMLDVEPWVCSIKAPIGVDTWIGDRYRK